MRRRKEMRAYLVSSRPPEELTVFLEEAFHTGAARPTIQPSAWLEIYQPVTTASKYSETTI